MNIRLFIALFIISPMSLLLAMFLFPLVVAMTVIEIALDISRRWMRALL